jgi:hypothetical protein
LIAHLFFGVFVEDIRGTVRPGFGFFDNRGPSFSLQLSKISEMEKMSNQHAQRQNNDAEESLLGDSRLNHGAHPFC